MIVLKAALLAVPANLNARAKHPPEISSVKTAIYC